MDRNICDCVSLVFNELKKSEMNLEKISQEAKDSIKRIADFYKISEKEAVLLVLAVETHYSEDSEFNIIGFKEIKETVDCDAMKLVPYKKQILSLVEKHYFFRKYTLDDNLNFKINDQVLEALYNEVFDGIANVGEDFDDKYAFLRIFRNLFDARNNYGKAYKVHMLANFEASFSSLDFVKQVISLVPHKEERFIFYDCCADFLRGEESDLLQTLSNVYYEGTARRKAKEMADEESLLLERNLLKVSKRDSIADSYLELTDSAKELLLEEDLCLYEKRFSSKDMIEPAAINEIKLFYSKENQKQLDTLVSYLSPVNFQKIQENLKDRGMKAGFAVLFYGSPGTGKTESVYQIAKKTNRGIVKVDVAKSKSCWFGESEKLIKEIFDKYKSVCKQACRAGENLPILLFNEADAIFSKRKDVNSGNVAQTENAIQNIILDEMESLEGILIATTNLTSNFDSAFERRFLYKIKFDMPSNEARAAIWESRLPALGSGRFRGALDRLSKYELSGGQIDNIVRKVTMEEILTGVAPSLEVLGQLCSQERLEGTAVGRRIGF